MKKTMTTIKLTQVTQHPYHSLVNKSQDSEFLVESIKRTGNTPIYPIVVVPKEEQIDSYWVVSGMSRIDTLIQMGVEETDATVIDISDENEIKNLIIDLNKQRIMTGYELKMRFKHYEEMYPQKKGKKGYNRYSIIGKEVGLTFEQVKEYVILCKFFSGDGEIVIDKLFGKELSANQVHQLKKVVELNPEKFNSEISFEKISNPEFDFNRIEYGIKYLSIDNDDEFKIMSSYLKKDMNLSDFEKTLEQLGRVYQIKQNHKNSKVWAPILSDEFITEHAHVIKGDNKIVPLNFTPNKKIRCLVGSPPYGDKRKNSDDTNNETGHHMSGQEYAVDLAERYLLMKPFMEQDGSIYIIIDDFIYKGKLACLLEYLVIEMEKRGFYLVGRYTWVKRNGMPRNYKTKGAVPNFEMAYRFVLDKDNYYTNPNLFLETGEGIEVSTGCTNHSKDGTVKRGKTYVQANLKKHRNTLDLEVLENTIISNVANPETWFIQANEKTHTSQYPPILSAYFILEGSEKGDVCCDNWNGVGNTMIGALLCEREYVGIEKENDFYQQTCRRVEAIENQLIETPFVNQPKIAA